MAKFDSICKVIYGRTLAQRKNDLIVKYGKEAVNKAEIATSKCVGAVTAKIWFSKQFEASCCCSSLKIKDESISTNYEHDGNIVEYEHHGTIVSVQQYLLGKHRKHCLCHAKCKFFKPNTPENCPLAQANYQFCVDNNMILPVWECPKYEHQ